MKSLLIALVVSFSLVAKAQIVVKASFAGKNDGTISKKELLQSKKLLVTVIQKDSSWALDDTWRITAFKLTVGGKDFEVKGDMIPAEAEAAMKQAAAGAKVVFDNINSNRGNMARGLPTITLTVVE